MPKNVSPVDPIVITVDELAGRLGGMPEYVNSWLKRLHLDLVDGHTFDADPGETAQGLPIAEAERFLRDVRSDAEEHRSRWQSYVAYRERRRREAAEEAAREAAEARRQSLAVSRRQAAIYQAQEAERAAEEAAREASWRAEREGRPVDFETFVSGQA